MNVSPHLLTGVPLTFVHFRETNDHEGESWNFWLQLDGNEDALAELGGVLDSHNDRLAEHEDPMFVLTGEDTGENELTEEEVDLLVRWGEDGYMAQHTKVVGVLALPDDFIRFEAQKLTELLYKGGIAKLFTAAEVTE